MDQTPADDARNDARSDALCAGDSHLLGRGFFRLVVSALGLVAFAAAVSPAASAKSFPPYGARGDKSFSDTCPAGEYLVGLRGRSGAWIDQIQISCRSLTGNLGGPFYGPARGGNGGGPSEIHCPGGYVINYVGFALTEGDRQVQNLLFECVSPTDRSKHQSIRLGTNVTTNKVPQRQPCPTGEAATGIAGHYGKHVNAIGLICSKLLVPSASRPAGSPPQPKR